MRYSLSNEGLQQKLLDYVYVAKYLGSRYDRIATSPKSIEITVQGILLGGGGAYATLIALGALEPAAAPATAPALDAVEQGPIDALGACYHINVRIQCEMQRHEDIRHNKERMRRTHAILLYGQGYGNLWEEGSVN